MTVDLAQWLLAAAVGLGGILFGLAYFAACRRSAGLFLRPGGRAAALALTLGRMACAVLLLWLAARQGALPLLAALAGFLVARGIAIRRPGEVP